MKDRIKAIRKHFKLTQAQFGERIGVKGNTVTTYESGDRTPSAAVADLICREFGVDLIWLETGIGEMFREQSSDERLAFRLGKIMASNDDDIHKRFVAAITEATAEELMAVEQLAARLLKE